MGWWSRLFGNVDPVDPAQRVLPYPHEPFVSTGGIPVADPGTPWEMLVNRRFGVEAMWRAQPNLRKTVDFIARHVASLKMSAYERVSDTERARVTGTALASVLSSPQPRVGSFRFWHGVLSDGLLYDRWLTVLGMDDKTGRDMLVHVPSWRTHFVTDPLNRVVKIHYWTGDRLDRSPGEDEWVDVPLDRAVFDHGYAPRTAGLSPVDTLMDILSESAEAVAWRRDQWENGTRAPGYVHRPAGAPQWEEAQRTRFVNGMRATYGRDGTNRGGLPLLEDGMEIKSTDVFSAQDMQDIESRRLTAIEVASTYHLPPELVGAREGTYSNIDAFRQMLFGPTLGPYVDAWEGALNAQLAPLLEPAKPTLYIEANIEAKLRGSFEEQAKIMQSATGAPWLTRNEARAMQNRAPLPGGDDLVVPLNVITGGQASPRDSGSQNQNSGRARTKAGPTDAQRDRVADVLAAFFARQGKSVLSALGSGGDWWDGERWDAELADDLHRVAFTVAGIIGKAEAERLGFSDDFDPDLTVEYLRAVAERYASNINATTKAQIDATLAADDPDPAGVFAQAEGARAAGVAVGVGTFLAGFASTEAAQQIARAQGVEPTKTWVAGPNPRPSHAALDGQTVPLDESFSNGMKWPGDASGGVDEVAGCNCTLVIDIP